MVTDEDRANAEKRKKAFDKSRKRGEVTGDSFDSEMAPKERKAWVTDIKGSQEEDGTVVIDSAMGYKRSEKNPEDEIDTRVDAAIEATPVYIKEVIALLGLDSVVTVVTEDNFADDSVVRAEIYALHHIAYHLSLTPLFANTEVVYLLEPPTEDEGEVLRVPLMIDADQLRQIAPMGKYRNYYRVEVMMNLFDAIRALEEENVVHRKIGPACGQITDSACWFASWTKPGAERLVKKFDLSTTTVTFLDKFGDPGVVVSHDDVIEAPPRPWDEDLTNWDALSPDDQEKQTRNIRLDEFVCCLQDVGRWGTLMHIAPVTWYKRTLALWTQPLSIDKRLPRGMKPVSPGIYLFRNQTVEELRMETNHAGIKNDDFFNGDMMNLPLPDLSAFD
jgi:hypothetical protein